MRCILLHMQSIGISGHDETVRIVVFILKEFLCVI